MKNYMSLKKAIKSGKSTEIMSIHCSIEKWVNNSTVLKVSNDQWGTMTEVKKDQTVPCNWKVYKTIESWPTQNLHTQKPSFCL